VLGRHDSCNVILDDPLASRRHAVVEFDGSVAVVHDLGSVNGVLVDGKRIKGTHTLRNGEELRLGGQVITVYLGAGVPEGSVRFRQGAQTLAAAETVALMRQETEEATSVRDGEALETLLLVADKMLAVGRGADAERILQVALQDVQDRAQRGVAIERGTLEAAAAVAVRLAEATRKGQWINYVFTLYRRSELVLPARVIDHLYSAVRVVDQVDMIAVRDYLTHLRSREAEFGPAERFLVRRLDGFERLAEWH
jgi:hypothetical protein